MGDEQAPEIDVDALIADVEAGKETNAAPVAEPPAAAAPPTAQELAELEFTAAGKQIKVPVKDPRTIQWLSKGYTYAQDMAEFNAKQAAFEKSQKEFEPLQKRYSEIDKYARENPQWLEHVNNSYIEAIGKARADGAPNSEIQALQSKLQETTSFIEEIKAERNEAKAKQDDQKLDGEIKSIQEKYKDLDWSTPNGDGKTLETQVIEFAIQNQIKNFEHAFKLFNHDSLITLHASRAKEEQVKTKQAQTKAGLLGSTPAPTKQLAPVRNLKSKSYNDLAREGLAELGITS